jgi:hypothetical protein
MVPRRFPAKASPKAQEVKALVGSRDVTESDVAEKGCPMV